MSTINASYISKATLSLCKKIREAGGRGWLVGGAVRDLLLGNQPKDSDIEIYGLDAEQLLQQVSRLGHTELVGKHFGIIKLWFDGHEFDLALPRTEKKVATGHRGFDVIPDPQLTPEKATLRRDFTINAMMYDPLQDELLDLHHGVDDLEAGRLRHVSQAFAEDPLRVLRAMQFAARFQLRLTLETAALCKKILPEASSLPISRIAGEWRKWATAPYPSFGLDVLYESGWLNLYPALAALVGCPQEPKWHPEGDVWKHTKLVVNQAAEISRREKLDQETTASLVFAALCHDFGKPNTTFHDEQGVVRSPGHAEAAKMPTQKFLKAIGIAKRQQKIIHPLVREHLVHLHGEPSLRAVRRLACRLMPTSISLWEMLVESDASGRPPYPPSRPALAWLTLAKALEADQQQPAAIVNGKMLIAQNIKPGKDMGRMIAAAYEAQLSGKISDEKTALKWLKRYCPSP